MKRRSENIKNETIFFRVATGSYTVESKRIVSRKLFRQVPGFQDVKNGSKRTKILENRENRIFAGFLGPIFPLKGCLFSCGCLFSQFGVDAGII